MFDLKKRSSLTLRGCRESEEFRRVAVRRKSAAVGASGAGVGLCGSYSYGAPHDKACDSEVGPNNKDESSPLTESLFPQGSLKQNDLKDQAAVNRQPLNPTKPDLSSNGDHRVSLTHASPSQNCRSSPSPVRGQTKELQSAACVANISPSSRGILKISGCPLLRSPSPGKRGLQSSSPLRDGGHSPAKLSPRSHSPFMGRLRTPSPVQKSGTDVSPKYSKPVLGRPRTPNKMEKRDKRAKKCWSVPDLSVCVDVDRIPVERTERSPLMLLQSTNCNRPGITIQPPERRRSDREPSPPGTNVGLLRCGRAPVEEVHVDDVIQEKTPSSCGSRFFCEWTKTTAEPEKDENNQRAEGGEAKEEETESKLFHIANELLQTERAYVARLHLLDQVFCLRLTEEAERGSFPPEVIRNIFSNVSSIYSFHCQFLLPDLESCICRWQEGPGLGKALLQHAPFLRMYADYVRNFDGAMELLKTWTERSSAFRSVINDVQSLEVCGNLTLQHHMLEPVQRVPRYEMLLKDYLKKLPEDHPDYQFSQKSLQVISMAATHSNTAIQKAESLKRQLEIYEMVGEEEVVNPTNQFLKEGRLLKLAARNTLAMERHLFMFNNFLLCCHPRFSLVGQRFTVRCRIGVDGMQVHQTTNEDHPYTFQVSGKERTLELQASCEQDRDEWIKVIQDAIGEFQEKHETFRLASKDFCVEKPKKELGKRAPRWIRDNEVSQCMTCQEPFNALTRRRHHCRACGYVVCWRCSENKAALEYDGNKLNKFEEKSAETVLTGFLQYDAASMVLLRAWCVLTRSVPACLHDVKPLLSIPLLDSVISSSSPELAGRHCFCINQFKTAHTFSCDSLEVKQSWMSLLQTAAMGQTRTPTASDRSTTGARSGADGGIRQAADP
ncbi:FYVE, RhoGEF and PH domain-containing protein 4 [Oryzias melastigma]|uniref:FYVE, RhoGEF and PH domain-containing protein 4 n=1 Tax=Oryzias melastigma TaxID=30732 RepID=A0A834CC48_ORYME|nr:FYVE, RhoGEF and PH domain-containing protein 4 [Oryzias melastigma]